MDSTKQNHIFTAVHKNQVLMKIWMLVPAMAGMIACNSGSGSEAEVTNEETTGTENVEVAEVAEFLYHGDSVSFDGAMTTEEMIAALGDQDSMEVKVAGEISGSCKKKGCWLSMPLADGQDMRVGFNYVFLLDETKDYNGKEVVIEGRVKKVSTSVEELRHYAHDAGKSEEEIAEITEPLNEYSFLATGVTIKQ